MSEFKIYLGDCLEVMADIPSRSVDLVLTDLPYGSTQNKWDAVIPFSPLWEQYERVCKPNAAIVLFAAQPFTSALVMSKPEWFKYDWTWRKPKGTGHLNAKKQPMRDKEDILVFYRQQPTYNPQFCQGKPYTPQSRGKSASRNTSSYGGFDVAVQGGSDGRRYPKQVIEFGVVERGTLHPTQKPTPLLEYMVRTYSNEGDTVLDNTMGSGSTGEACLNTGRRFVGIEKSPEYFAIAKNRLYQVQPSLLEAAE